MKDGENKAGESGTVTFENVSAAQLDAAHKLQAAVEKAMEDAQAVGVGYVCIERKVAVDAGSPLPRLETHITALDPETVLRFETPEAAFKAKTDAEAWAHISTIRSAKVKSAPEFGDERARD